MFSAYHSIGLFERLPADFFLVSIAYALLTAAICVFEARRIRTTGADLISVFVALFVLQCCLPGIVIFAALPLVSPLEPTETQAFDRIYTATDVSAALLVFGLTAWTVVLFYAFTAMNGKLMRRFVAHLPSGSMLVLYSYPTRLLIALFLGFILSCVSFYLIGDTLVERYANLILLRAYSEEVERNTLNAYAFSLTQSWAWLSVPALFVMFERRGRRLSWLLCILFAVAFAVLGVSRRAIFIPIVLIYLTLVVYDGRWRGKVLLAAALPVVFWVAFGKEIFSAIAFGGTVGEVTSRYESMATGALRAATEIGITVVESLGSINLLDLAPRYGVDHLLSVLRRIPVGWFGGDLELPKRIVRVSTEAFASPDDQDIPPGLFGQMWLDFRVFGPIVWAFVLSLQVSLVQRVFALTVRTRQATAAFVLVVFIIALPLNTGSYDFTFSVDIFAVMLVLLLTFRFAAVRIPAVGSPGEPRLEREG
jgi:hypothetical protein